MEEAPEDSASPSMSFVTKKLKKSGRFKKSAVHRFFEKKKNALGHERYECIFCRTQPASSSCSTTRLINHILGGCCHPNGKDEKESLTKAVKLLQDERNVTKKITKEEVKKKEVERALNRKRTRESLDNFLLAHKKHCLLLGKDGTTKIEVDSAWTRFFFGDGVPTRKAKSPLFLDAIEKTIAYGKTYRVPRPETFNTTLLQNEVERLRKSVLNPLAATFKKYGASMESDGWTNQQHTPLLNFLVYCRRGVYFEKAIATEGTTKTMHWIAEAVINVMKNSAVPIIHYVSVVMDGATLPAMRIIEKRLPTIECQWCSAHVMNLVLMDFYKEVAFIKKTTDIAKGITKFIYSHQKSLALFRMSRKKELAKWNKTRFGTAFLTCASVLREMEALRITVVKKEWDEWARTKDYADTAAKNKEIILTEIFWKLLEQVVNITEKVFKVLRLLDSDKPTMPFIFEWWLGLETEISKLQIVPGVLLESDIAVLTKIVRERWDGCHANLHSAGFMLNPRNLLHMPELRDKDTAKLMLGLKRTIKMFHPNNEEKRRAALRQYILAADGSIYMEHDERTDADVVEPAEWWAMYGEKTPLLQAIAMKVLSHTTTSSSCERNWSDAKYVEQGRFTLSHGNFEKRLFIYRNAKLERALAQPAWPSSLSSDDGSWSDPSQSPSEEDERAVGSVCVVGNHTG